MISIPIQLYVASESHVVSFRQLCADHVSQASTRCGTPTSSGAMRSLLQLVVIKDAPGRLRDDQAPAVLSCRSIQIESNAPAPKPSRIS